MITVHPPRSPGIQSACTTACAKHLTYHHHSPNLRDLIQSLPAPIDQSFAALELVFCLYS